MNSITLLDNGSYYIDELTYYLARLIYKTINKAEDNTVEKVIEFGDSE